MPGSLSRRQFLQTAIAGAGAPAWLRADAWQTGTRAAPIGPVKR